MQRGTWKKKNKLNGVSDKDFNLFLIMRSADSSDKRLGDGDGSLESDIHSPGHFIMNAVMVLVALRMSLLTQCHVHGNSLRRLLWPL